MAKTRIVADDVYILEEVFPYEGNEILGVFVSVEAALESRKDNKKYRWREAPDTEQGGTLWLTQLEGRETAEPWLVITKHPVRSK